MLPCIIVFNLAEHHYACRIPSAKHVEVLCKHAQLDSFCNPSADFLSAFLDLHIAELWHSDTDDMVKRLHACADIITLRQPSGNPLSPPGASDFDHIQLQIPLLKSRYCCGYIRQPDCRMWAYDQEIQSL